MTVSGCHHRDRDGGIDGVEPKETPVRDGILHRLVSWLFPKLWDEPRVQQRDQARESQQLKHTERHELVCDQLVRVGPPTLRCNTQPANTAGCKL